MLSIRVNGRRAFSEELDTGLIRMESTVGNSSTDICTEMDASSSLLETRMWATSSFQHSPASAIFVSVMARCYPDRSKTTSCMELEKSATTESCTSAKFRTICSMEKASSVMERYAWQAYGRMENSRGNSWNATSLTTNLQAQAMPTVKALRASFKDGFDIMGYDSWQSSDCPTTLPAPFDIYGASGNSTARRGSSTARRGSSTTRRYPSVGPSADEEDSATRYLSNEFRQNMNGKAILAFSSGDTYVGCLRDGKKHGQGMYIYANLSAFKGEWENDTLDGALHPRENPPEEVAWLQQLNYKHQERVMEFIRFVNAQEYLNVVKPASANTSRATDESQTTNVTDESRTQGALDETQIKDTSDELRAKGVLNEPQISHSDAAD
eukprot:GEMP01048831.1.p1 GENE.GEMP01048831.1~~GEMP01048831.1.p1  ORF type:complete len:382 (+),score=72.21 GEMP01048831.1:137-1282(+)